MKRLLPLFLVLLFWGASYAEEIVSQRYPNLDFTILNWAKIVKMDNQIVFKSGEITYTEASLLEEIKRRFPEMEEEAKENLLFFLEEILGKQLLLSTAKKEGHKGQSEEEAIMNLLLSKVADVKVDDKEVKTFYDENLSKIQGMSFDTVKDQIRVYLTNIKKKEAIREYLQNFGKDKNLQIDKSWLEANAKKLFNNVVDQARASGKVTMVQFGANGCEPCELMRPILKELTEKYKGKKNIVFVDVNLNKILAVRYGVEVIPVQTFYDTKGKEVFRHMGFFSKEQIEQKFAEIEKGGVR